MGFLSSRIQKNSNTCVWIFTVLTVNFLLLYGCKSNVLAPVTEYTQNDEQSVYTATKRGDYAEALQIIDSYLSRNPHDGLFYKLKGNVLLMQNKLSLREVYLAMETQKQKDKKDNLPRDDIGRLLMVVEPMTPAKTQVLQDANADYKKAIENSPGKNNLESLIGEQHTDLILMLTVFPTLLIATWKSGKKIDSITVEELRNDPDFTEEQADHLLDTFETKQNELEGKFKDKPETLKKFQNVQAEVKKMKEGPGDTNREKIIEYLKQRGGAPVPLPVPPG